MDATAADRQAGAWLCANLPELRQDADEHGWRQLLEQQVQAVLRGAALKQHCNGLVCARTPVRSAGTGTQALLSAPRSSGSQRREAGTFGVPTQLAEEARAATAPPAICRGAGPSATSTPLLAALLCRR